MSKPTGITGIKVWVVHYLAGIWDGSEEPLRLAYISIQRHRERRSCGYNDGGWSMDRKLEVVRRRMSQYLLDR